MNIIAKLFRGKHGGKNSNILPSADVTLQEAARLSAASELFYVNCSIQEGNRPFVWQRHKSGALVASTAEYDKNTYIASDAIIGPDVVLRGSSVGARSLIGRNTVLSRVIVPCDCVI